MNNRSVKRIFRTEIRSGMLRAATVAAEIGRREKLNGPVQLIFISRQESGRDAIGGVDRKRGGIKGTYRAELFSNRLEVLSDWLHFLQH